MRTRSPTTRAMDTRMGRRMCRLTGRSASGAVGAVVHAVITTMEVAAIGTVMAAGMAVAGTAAVMADHTAARGAAAAAADMVDMGIEAVDG